MDKRFLEFWGNFLIHAARGQEQVETLQRLANEGFRACEFHMNLFREFYGLKKKADPSEINDQIREKATADFLESCREFTGLLGLVPRKTYDALVRENDDLKSRITELEKALKTSGKKTRRQEPESGLVAKGIEGLMKKQADQFQTLMTTYGKLFENIKPLEKPGDIESSEPISPGGAEHEGQKED
ncbi:MAG: hypothetical protein WCX84_04045 [Syntrophales bacterium]|jgi:regulator of replication initiation timing|nr:hypothetical protein [Syntrophales bacterium]NLN59730.1 hypothetical protein [Deltaproteobacteria bacterium]